MHEPTDLAVFVPHQADLGSVRVLTIDGEPWFVASDLSTILGVTDLTRATQRLAADERRKIDIDTTTGAKTVVIVSEPGMYRMVLTSRKPVAESLRRWITREVLPKIRKQGAYLTDKLSDELARVLDAQDRSTDLALYEMSVGLLDQAALHLRQARDGQHRINELIDRQPLPITRGCVDQIRHPEMRKALGLAKTRTHEIGPADDQTYEGGRTYRYPAVFAR